MAYYDQLIAAWNNPTQPPNGVTGTGLAAGDSTQQKLDKINAWTITGQKPTAFDITGIELFNCVNVTEFNTLTATQQANLLAMFQTAGTMLCGTDNANKLAWGMMNTYFTAGNGPTMTALKALAKAQTVFWCAFYGYPLNQQQTAGGLTLVDASNAGLS